MVGRGNSYANSLSIKPFRDSLKKDLSPHGLAEILADLFSTEVVSLQPQKPINLLSVRFGNDREENQRI